jgi:hypothetical protein
VDQFDQAGERILGGGEGEFSETFPYGCSMASGSKPAVKV